MSDWDSIEKQPAKPAPSTMLIEVQIQQSHLDCPGYTWDREAGCLRMTALSRAQPGLPADVATLQLEGKAHLPVLLPTAYSVPPGTLVQARLLGGLVCASSTRTKEQSLPSDGWVFVAVPEADASFAASASLEMLPEKQLDAMKVYVQARVQEEFQSVSETITCSDAQTAARVIRETRLELKREQRSQPKERAWRKHEQEEKPVAWRAVEGLSQALRLQLLRGRSLQTDEQAPHAQAEHLIRFVPQRFQDALADLLLDDERLLAFVERLLLHHRTGWLGLQTWRSNEGLFLVTDRQVLWLRDFLAPGSNFLPGGYIAHSAALERLQSITILPPGPTLHEWINRLETKDSPYLRLVLEIASGTGSEPFVVEFPQGAEAEKALARLHTMLQTFLPYQEGAKDRRVRRLPEVDVWMPRGAEAEQLVGLGGLVRPEIAGRLEQRLSQALTTWGEERLISTLVPALEDFKSPARLVALTRHALIVLDDRGDKSSHAPLAGEQEAEQAHAHRYDLTTISSAQLRYSLLGSSLSIFVPQADGHTQQQTFPFHSPAIAWFLPLFTRLRLLLNGPYLLP